MIIRWEIIVGLILSLGLNMGVFFFGLHLFAPKTQWVLASSAGSQSTMSKFTFEVVARSAGGQEELPEIAKENPESTSNQRSLGRSLGNQRSSSNLAERASLEASSILGYADLITMESSDEGYINPDIVSDIKSLIFEAPKERESKEIEAKEIGSARTNPKPKAANSTHKGEEISQINTNAREGDQFAREIAATIHAQIQGCYPEASKRRGEEGVVYLSVFKEGDKLQVEVVTSSGYTRLDRCAIDAVKKVLQKIDPKQVPANGFQLKPIRFQLRN